MDLSAVRQQLRHELGVIRLDEGVPGNVVGNGFSVVVHVHPLHADPLRFRVGRVVDEGLERILVGNGGGEVEHLRDEKTRRTRPHQQGTDEIARQTEGKVDVPRRTLWMDARTCRFGLPSV